VLDESVRRNSERTGLNIPCVHNHAQSCILRSAPEVNLAEDHGRHDVPEEGQVSARTEDVTPEGLEWGRCSSRSHYLQLACAAIRVICHRRFSPCTRETLSTNIVRAERKSMAVRMPAKPRGNHCQKTATLLVLALSQPAGASLTVPLAHPHCFHITHAQCQKTGTCEFPMQGWGDEVAVRTGPFGCVLGRSGHGCGAVQCFLLYYGLV
jgi:hypothetical protein